MLARVNDCLKSGNSHILDSCIDNGKWLEAKILRKRNAESLSSSTKTVNDVPVTVPQSGWKAFSSQDLNLPSLFNYGIVLANTCPVDNWLMIFQALVTSGRIDLDDLAGAGKVIKTALSLIDRQEYGDAKLACLPTGLAVKKGVTDLYGN